jgi:hypothetical protein
VDRTLQRPVERELLRQSLDAGDGLLDGSRPVEQSLCEQPGERPDHFHPGLRPPRVLERPLDRLRPRAPAACGEVAAAP